MGGVGGAVDRSVGDEHRTLASAPPETQRPAGAPQTLRGKPRTDAPAQYSQEPAQQAAEPEREDAQVEGAKEPEGQIEAEKAEEPGAWDSFAMALGFIGGKLVNGVASLFGADKPVVDPQELAAKFAGLPTKDEALKQAQAGNAPGVQMQGAAGQAASEQDGHVDAKGQETLGTARDDAGRGMGEDQVYPDAPKEQLTAKVPGRQGGGGQGVGAGGGATGAVPPEAASEVAEHERGPQFRAAFSEGQKGMSESRQAKDRDFRDSQAKHKQQVDAEIATNTEAQTGEREKAMAEVTAQREDWRAEQDQELKSLGDKKTDRREKVRQDVEDEEKKTDDNVDKEKEGSDKKIQDEADRAEREADQKKNTAAEDSGNWVTKAFDWIKQKVIEIKNAIVRVIRAARNAVIGFIRTFKDTVTRWIDEARKNIVDAIKNFIKDLIEFAKAMVRAVIDLAKRIRNLVTSLIQAAIALVNRLSQMLKQMITDLLNALGKLLSSILDILKKALLDVLKAVVDTVKGILQFAAGMLSALGDFMLIAVDFLSDPGGWLSGAKNSAVDGAKNHLFREVKSAVKAWFQSKIEEILGIPKAVFDKLLKGGITLEQIVKETWDAIVPQLPLIIGEIVITKVIAKLIPGAGWVMAVIDAIRTAIGALGEILRAMGAVLDWLKAVRTGGAGILFAKAVAAGIVALLELAYEALLSGIGKYVAKVGRRFKDIAAKLGKGKGDKPGGGKGAGTDGSHDKGKEKTGQDEPAKKPGTDGKPPTTTAPKPTQTKEGAPGQPKTPGDGKTPTTPTAKDKNGKPKDKNEKPDTTPSPKPTPKAEPRPKPKPEPDTKPKDTDAKSPDKSRDAEDAPGAPKDKDTDGKTPDKPKDQNPSKPRPEDKAKNKDGDKPDKPRGQTEDGKRPKPKHEAKDPKKSKRDKHEDRRSKDKDPEKEKQDKKAATKKKEDSPESKDKRLNEIVARLRPPLSKLLAKGVGRTVHRSTLTGLRLWYRLTELSVQGASSFNDLAVLNPRKIVINGRELDSEPILLYIRTLENDILTQRDQQQAAGNGGQQITVDREEIPGRRPRLRAGIPQQMDIASVSTQLKRSGLVTQVMNWGRAAIWRTRLPSGPYLLKFRNSGTYQERDTNENSSTKYREILKRLLRSSSIAGVARSLGRWHSDRRSQLPYEESEDIALVGSLAYLGERDRNPGNMVTSILLADLYNQVPTADRRREILRLHRTFNLQPMIPAGSPVGAKILPDYLEGPPGALDRAIEGMQDEMRLSDNHPGAALENARGYLERFTNGGPGRNNRDRVQRMRPGLTELRKLQDANNLANREVRLIELWFESIYRNTDFGAGLSEEELQKEIREKIKNRLQSVFPWWTPQV
jgi:hypothetical protein